MSACARIRPSYRGNRGYEALFGRGGRRGAALVAGLALAAVLSLLQAAPASARSGGVLSARLAELAKPAVGGGSRAEQARSLSLAASGPGSLLRRGDRVLVRVGFEPGGVEPGELRAAGADVVNVSDRYRTATAEVRPERLRAVARLPGVDAVSEVLTPLVAAAGDAGPGASAYVQCNGAATSEGDTHLHALEARQTYDLDGTGSTVGVLSDSYDTDESASTTAADDVASGDLPGSGNPCSRTSPVSVLEDLNYSGDADEGRGMAQIVHDLAPGAKLAFATAFTSEVGFAQNIERLAKPIGEGGAGADVIVDDVFYFAEPFFQEGPIAVAADNVAASGAAYFSAAGNDNLIDSSGRDIASWEAPSFRDAPECPADLGASASRERCMDFNPGEGSDNTFGLTVAAGVTLTVDLQWAEPRNGVSTDIDVWLLDSSGKRIKEKGAYVRSFYDNPGGSQEPFEFFQWTNSAGSSREVQLAVVRCFGECNPSADSGTAPRLKFMFLQNGGGVTATEYPESSGGDVVGPTIFGHAGAQGAIGVGAVPYNSTTKPESYSSRGPVTHYFGPVTGPGAAPALGSPQVLSRPDVAATDGGATTFFGSLISGTWRFYGTSAAAPHAAAVAALIRDADPAATPAQIRTTLAETANPVGSYGPNAVGGGLVDALGAVGEFAEDETPPDTTIDSGPEGPTNDTTPTFGFSSTEEPATFECRVDEGAYLALHHAPHDRNPRGRLPHLLRAGDRRRRKHRPDPGVALVHRRHRTARHLDRLGPRRPHQRLDPDLRLQLCGRRGDVRVSLRLGILLVLLLGEQPHALLVAGRRPPHLLRSRHRRSRKHRRDPGHPLLHGRHRTARDLDRLRPHRPDQRHRPRPSASALPTQEPHSSVVWTQPPSPPAAPPTRPHPLADGSHTFYVRATDAAENTDPTPATRSFTVDTEAPQTSITTGPTGPTNDTTPTFEFSSTEEPATFECRVDEGSFAPCTTPHTTATLADGSHTFYVRATDAAENTDPTPASRSFTVDTEAPQTSIVSGPTGPTNDSTPTFGFSSADGGATFECRFDSESFSSCSSASSHTPSSPLSDGSHTFYVRATDEAGNTDPTPATRSFTVDTEAPETSIDSGPEGATNDTTPTFGFESPDEGATFECRVDAGAFAPCSSPHTTGSLAEGAHTFDVRATDAADNTDPTPATRSFTVDTGPPDTSITTGPTGPTNDSTPTFGFSSPDGGATFECRFDSESFSSCSSASSHTPSSPLSDGSHTFYVRATDEAGNADPTPATRSFNVDTEAPDTAIDFGPEGLTNDPTPTFGFSSPDAGATFECRFDSQPFAACSSATSHTPFSPLSDGPHTFEVRAADAAGNVDASPASRSFTVDTEPPETSIDSGPTGPTNDTTPTFGFSSPDGGATFECRFDSEPFAVCSDAASHTPSSPLADGAHTFYVRATDEAENPDATPATRPFNVDTEAPDTAIDFGPTGPTNDSTPTFGFSSPDGGATFECRFDSESFSSCSSASSHTPSSPLSDGSHTFHVRATDEAGNADPTPATRSFTVDTTVPDETPPDTTIDSGPAGPTNDTTPTFGFSSTEEPAHLRVPRRRRLLRALHHAPHDRNPRRRLPHLLRAGDRRSRKHRPDACDPHLHRRHPTARHVDRLRPRRPHQRPDPDLWLQLSGRRRDLRMSLRLGVLLVLLVGDQPHALLGARRRIPIPHLRGPRHRRSGQRR